MGEIPEEDEGMDSQHEAAEKEKMIPVEKKPIPKTGGFVKSRPETAWKEVFTRICKIFLPCRSTQKDDKELPVEKVGCCSFIWLHWMTKPMIRAYKHGLNSRDLFTMPTQDQAKFNGERLQRLWEEEQEVAAKAGREPSFVKCILRFGKTRLIFASIFLIISVVLQFLAPSLVLKLILDFVDDPSQNIWWGWGLVLILGILLLVRSICFSLNFTISILTATRVLGAAQYMGFSKLLRLSSPNDGSLGQFLTFCTGDQERIGEAVIGGLLFVGTPVMFLMSIVYVWYLVGPIALLGCFTILLFYPLMGGLAALTSVLRLRVVTVSDKRVTLMNEIVGAMRLIKMYAWEDPFRQRVQDIRRQERKELQKAAFLQSISTSITPSITIIAIIVTIMALTFTGFPLTAPLAFTLFSIFSALQFTVGTLPYSLKCITEAKVGFNRLQKLLEMPEHKPPQENSADEVENEKSTDDHFSIAITSANLAWDMAPSDNAKNGKLKKKKSKAKKSKENGKKKIENGEPPAVSAEGEDAEAEKEALNKEGLGYVQCLNNIDLRVEPGLFLGVAGHIGSGKSSLISAIMGEMKLLSGHVRVKGGLAVVPQQAWIFNGTVRDNILFGSDFDQKEYDKVIDACALKADLEILQNGDQALIGEKGVNLSGGQKQRISLARALYAADDCSIFLLDDPLSAVDPKVAKEIFEKYIIGVLREKKKTVVFVTHGMQFLRQCDRIVFMKGGSIIESGTFNELMSTKTDFENLVSYEHQEKPKQTGETDDEEENTSDVIDEQTEKRKSPTKTVQRLMSVGGNEENHQQNLVALEETEVYEAGWAVMLRYFKACGGYFVTFLLFLSMFIFALARLFTAIWLQIWLDAGDGRSEDRQSNATLSNVTLTDEVRLGYITDNPRLWFYQLIYGISVIILLILGVIKAVSLAIRLLAGSSKLHDSMLKRILYSPMAFFDVTPSGRIINRFSKDMDEMDVRIPFYLEFVTTSIMFCATQIALVCFVYPIFTIAFFVIIVVFLTMDLFMNQGVSMTKRIDNETKSAILHDISSMVPGIPVIRAFERQFVFQQQFDANVNRHLSAQSMFRFSNRWFSLRMDLLGTLTIVTVAAVAVACKGTVSAASAGLALANVFQVATFIPFVMMLKAEFRARFNSVERVCQYANDLPQEAESHIPDKAPPKDWPKEGAIRFDQVCLRYRADQPQVLRGLTFEAQPGDKVGIVGRTGAGKTSLFGALLRLTELDEGKVFIDGVDVARIGLTDLRSSVAVIPQDPVLFQGTLRYNLDPFSRYDDEALWSALEKAHLKEKIVSTNQDPPGSGLDMNVETEGDNFSVGEKQLICLARALLRGNKILLLDEATASVDLQTDFLIQSTIREAFATSTVLTIAHRVHTIVNYDKVIVMQRGKIVEQGKPSDLLKMKDGIFASMLTASRAPITDS